MSQWAVDQISEGGFDDGVAAVGDIGLGDPEFFKADESSGC
jgi:hypothetical protein